MPILIFRATGNALLDDSDTAFLISKLNEYQNPWRWFTHDWPLENHFYRPISTLTFEWDNRLHPGNGDGFGLTNALICVLATLALYWLLCEVKRSIPVAVAGTWLFATWTLGSHFLGAVLPTIVSALPWLFLILILWRMNAERKFKWESLGIAAGGFFIWNRIIDINPDLSSRTMYWLPGRTATSMTIFALVALASYVRFERLGAPSRAEKEPGPMDPPATRNSNQRGEPQNHWGWFLVSCSATALALATYEQAVMIPSLIFILGVWLRVHGLQTRFSFQIFFWAILVAYLVYRVQIIPVQPSGYQKQQFRHGSGLWIDIFNYVLPGLFGIIAAWNAITTGIFALLTDSVWTPLAYFTANVSGWISIRKAWLKPALMLSLALFSYLPMAFLKQFGHYHYFPEAVLTLFVIALFEAYWPRLVAAISPQAIQAPKRVERAPGSLPRL